MRLLKLGLLTTVLLVCAAPSHAQILFSRKPKINPNQRVPELIVIVKSDADERKRAYAAEELRDYDPAVFSEIVPVLADVLQHDKKQNVRLEALQSLTKIRPVTPVAGRAIEKAAAEDDSVRVRLQAKAALPKYHLAGYLSKNNTTPTEKKTVSASPAPVGKQVGKQTQEPPLAEPSPIALPTPPMNTARPITIPPPPTVTPRPNPISTPPPPTTTPRPVTIPTPPPATTTPPAETPSDRPIPRPFPIPTTPTTPAAPAEGPSLFP